VITLTSSPFAAPDNASPAETQRSLVLAGGGMRVAYQAGVLAALEQAGLRFHHVDGASGGTMNLSMLLGGQGSEEIGQRWRTLHQRDFSAMLPWRDYTRSLRWPALGSARGLREKVFPHLGIDPDLIRRATGIIGTYNVCNFATKTAEVFEHNGIDLDLLIAAVSLPVLMPAVVRSGTPYTDAVWIRDSNVPEAVRRGSDEIWLVWCIANAPVYHNGLFRQYVHMIEMAANGSLLRDLDYVAARWPRRPVRIHVIRPEHPIPLDPAYYFGRIDAATLIDLGYQDACRYLDDPAPMSPPWEPSITQMREAAPGAAARLILEGPFTVSHRGAAEGCEWDRRNETTIHRIQLHLQVQERGRDGAHCRHELSVAGDVTAPGLKPRTLIEKGTAVLDPAAGLTLRLRWRSADGPQSLLARPASEHALAVTLHDDRDSRIIGTGTVPFAWRQAARSLGTVHATDARSNAEAAQRRTALAVALLRAAQRKQRPDHLPASTLSDKALHHG
jgi:predicted acylesterase/phospholipase RssA